MQKITVLIRLTLLSLAIVAIPGLARAAGNFTPAHTICEYPAPPIGFHYEGGDPETQCGAYLVPDEGTGEDSVG